MNSFITLSSIHKKNSNIIYNFHYSENLQKYFNKNEVFFINYNGLNIDTVPDSILIIPFLCNILPIAWLLDADVHVPEVDKDFYESIPMLKEGYVNLYKNLDFMGRLFVENVVINNITTDNCRNMAFFSGGVDSFNTLINHIEEKPLLITLFGSDISLNDFGGQNNVKNHVERVAENFSLNCLFVNSNFRNFINYSALGKIIYRKIKDNWWHAVQCGIGVISHAAPVAYLYCSKIVYFASTYTVNDLKIVTSASAPSIDNHIKWADTVVMHDGFEFTRQDKIRNICNFARKFTANKISFRVCWESSGGGNCNECEKCYRTMMGIIADGHDPNDFGFHYSEIVSGKIRDFVTYQADFNISTKIFWSDIQNRFLSNHDMFANHPDVKWIEKINFEKIDRSILRYIYRVYRKYFNFLKMSQ